MRNGVAAFSIVLLIVLIVMATVTISSLLKTGGTSVNEIAGGITVSGCRDNDGAYGYYTKDICTGTNGNFTDYCSGSYLKEYYCSGNSCYSKSVSCPSGYKCYNGICTKQPSAPALLYPPNGAKEISTKPTLSWSNTVMPGYGWYYLYYKKSTATAWSVISNIKTNSYTFTSPLSSYTTYKWDVVACNPGPLCTGSAIISFRTIQIVST